jgi:Kef-type K+ transport system membrane component KefB
MEAINYYEPDIITILIEGSFLLALNIISYIFDNFSCGLVGQLLLGILWGTPGAKWLSTDFEEVVISLGYIGLMLIVFEGKPSSAVTRANEIGGLSTSIDALKKNFMLSMAVAITGITLPVAFSFILARLVNASYLQCFAAGAALCSTSLGTTFTLLQSSGLTKTRLGIILTSAAMMDDIIGLIMVQVIGNLNESFKIEEVVRPIGVSIAFALVSILSCYVISKLKLSFSWSKKNPSFLTQTLFLIGMVTGASYAGTSNLFAAYLAGACIAWYSDHFSKPGQIINPRDMYERYYANIVNRLLKPLFFVSFFCILWRKFSRQISYPKVGVNMRDSRLYQFKESHHHDRLSV